jgi:hypothetical protein
VQVRLSNSIKDQSRFGYSEESGNVVGRRDEALKIGRKRPALQLHPPVRRSRASASSGATGWSPRRAARTGTVIKPGEYTPLMDALRALRPGHL